MNLTGLTFVSSEKIDYENEDEDEDDCRKSRCPLSTVHRPLSTDS